MIKKTMKGRKNLIKPEKNSMLCSLLGMQSLTKYMITKIQAFAKIRKRMKLYLIKTKSLPRQGEQRLLQHFFLL
jgi:hypothetical protein